MDRALIHQRLMNANRDAQRCAQELIAADQTDHALIQSLLFHYISIRFFLEPEELLTDDLYGLAEIAVAKTLAIKREKLAEIDIPGTCTGASSATSKKILLLLALRRDLGIDLTPEQAVKLQTVNQLARHIERALQAKASTKEE